MSGGGTLSDGHDGGCWTEGPPGCLRPPAPNNGVSHLLLLHAFVIIAAAVSCE